MSPKDLVDFLLDSTVAENNLMNYMTEAGEGSHRCNTFSPVFEFKA